MKVKVSSLKHHPKNKEIYTLSSIEELMESISEVGLLQSLIIDQHNQIISGKRKGLRKLYHENGHLQTEGNLKDDKLEGLWKMYDENGQLKQELNFKNGELIN